MSCKGCCGRKRKSTFRDDDLIIILRFKPKEDQWWLRLTSYIVSFWSVAARLNDSPKSSFWHPSSSKKDYPGQENFDTGLWRIGKRWYFLTKPTLMCMAIGQISSGKSLRSDHIQQSSTHLKSCFGDVLQLLGHIFFTLLK